MNAWHGSNVRTIVHDVSFRNLETEPVVPVAREAGNANRFQDNRRNSLGHLALLLVVLLVVSGLSAAPIYTKRV